MAKLLAKNNGTLWHNLSDVHANIRQSNKTTVKWVHSGPVEYNATIMSPTGTPACGRYVQVGLNKTDTLTICGLEVHGQDGKSIFPSKSYNNCVWKIN